MAQTIMMAKRYNKRPSELLGIENDYLAYIFDETAFFLENKATDKEGNIRWTSIRWSDTKGKGSGNEALIRFAQTGK